MNHIKHDQRLAKPGPLKEIGMEFVRVTEAAAIAASAWVGSGDKLAADEAATNAMEARLESIESFAAQVAIGEGMKDESHGLFKGDTVGGAFDMAGEPRRFDLAVDPIDGTTPTVNGGPEAMSVLAVACEGCMYDTEEYYMLKMVVGPEVVDLWHNADISLERPISDNLARIAAILDKPVEKLTVCMLNRPRHEAWIKEIRCLGTRLKLIQDCDVSGAIAACMEEHGIDVLYGVGGAPEAVLAAAAVKSLGGAMFAQVWRDGQVSGPILNEEGLVRGPCVFSATGITDGSLLKGVRWTSRGPRTNSLFCRSESGTVRFVDTRHGN